jgi:ABC-type nitrate/sulfonate/bicarbonate transport system substrate-binding protein
VVIGAAFFGAVGTGLFGLSQAKEVPLKVGWQTAWADNGYIIEPWKNTDILAKHELNAEIVPFVTGMAMLEPAAAKRLDVIFLGTPVTAVLFSKSDDWVIVSRMADFPISIIAGSQTGITDIRSLKGKKIGTPFGSGPYAAVLQALKKNRLDPKTDVTLVNLKPTEFAQALQTGAVDAVAWSSPSKETLEAAGVGKAIYQVNETGVMLVSKDLIKSNPQAVRALVSALKESQFYFIQNQDLVQNWYAKDSSLDLKLVKSIQKVEPNYSAKSIDEINLGISDSEIVPIQERFDLLFKEGVISKPVIFKEHLDFNFLK